MYNPQRFKSENNNEAFELMELNPFSTVVSISENLPFISHLPLIPQRQDDEIILIGHLAKANPHWRLLTNSHTTAIFHGPHTYITPKWYEENDVPTWNYSTVHVTGSLQLIENFDGIVECLKALSAHSEKLWPSGWDFFIPEDLSGDILTKNIVGFKMTVDTINFKKKLSQNKSNADREGIFKGLKSRQDEASQKVLKDMIQNFSKK